MVDWRMILNAHNGGIPAPPNREKSQQRIADSGFFPFLPCSGEIEGDVDTWQGFYNERVAIAMEGNLSVVQAEQQALRECINRWLAMNPDCHADPDTCPECHKHSGVTSAIPSMQYLNAGGWPLWIHDGCIQAWCERRRQEATAALAGIGIMDKDGVNTYDGRA